MALILAIESSCDETAIAIIRDGTLLSNIVSSQVDVHTKYGGVMPEIASRLHVENIGVVLKEALERANVKIDEIEGMDSVTGVRINGNEVIKADIIIISAGITDKHYHTVKTICM